MDCPIEVEHLSVRYGDVLALDDASLTLNQRAICGLIGMNGSGKSTLFKAIMGLVPIHQGEVRVAGLSPGIANKSGMVGYVPQSEEVDWAFPLSVAEVVMMGRYGHLGWTRTPREIDKRLVVEAIERVDLSNFASRQIGALSGGQRKRAFLARALAQGASILLLDEPFAGVDKPSEATITRLLREHSAAGGTTLVSTHDLHALPALCDDAILLMQRVLLHDRIDVVLRPENLALALGLAPDLDTGGR